LWRANVYGGSNTNKNGAFDFNKVTTLFVETLKNEPKFLMLAAVDISKLFLSLIALSWSPNITL